VHEIVVAYSKRHSVPQHQQKSFMEQLQSEWPKLSEPIGSTAQKVWTSQKTLQGREFCSILNEIIRDDEMMDKKLADQVALLARAINSGVGDVRDWPKGPKGKSSCKSTEANVCFRGGGFKDTKETRAFFVQSKMYRVAGFLASSFLREKAQLFINRVSCCILRSTQALWHGR
jgi:hypothetical protein